MNYWYQPPTRPNCNIPWELLSNPLFLVAENLHFHSQITHSNTIFLINHHVIYHVFEGIGFEGRHKAGVFKIASFSNEACGAMWHTGIEDANEI